MEKENSKIEEISRECVEGLLEKMGFAGQISTKKSLEEDKTRILVNIETQDSNFLIGQYGVNLEALQHLSRVIIRKKIEEKIDLVVDVNSYRQEKSSSIIKMAQDLAEQALRENRAVALRPMSAYERRLVHTELSKNEKITTESVGEGEERKVVIKPATLL
jgi:spoIIIJ-associated protein